MDRLFFPSGLISRHYKGLTGPWKLRITKFDNLGFQAWKVLEFLPNDPGKSWKMENHDYILQSIFSEYGLACTADVTGKNDQSINLQSRSRCLSLSHSLTLSHTHTHTYTHIHTHTHIYTYTHTHIHTHIYTHTLTLAHTYKLNRLN